MTFIPWGIGDFRDNRFDTAAGFVEAVVETDRIKNVAKVTQVGQQADGAGRPPAGRPFDTIAHRLLERRIGMAEIVAAFKPGRCRFMD